MLLVLFPLVFSAIGLASAANTPVLAYSSPKPFLGLEQGTFDNTKNDGVVMFLPGEQEVSSAGSAPKVSELTPSPRSALLEQDFMPAGPCSY